MEPSVGQAPTMRRLAIIDAGSFVLPYDYHLVRALCERGYDVDFYGSATRYNGEFVEAMRELPGVRAQVFDISGSVASPVRALRGYAHLLWTLWRQRSRYDLIVPQFLARWYLELPLYLLLRRRIAFTIHNAVPHGHVGRRYWPFAVMARAVRALWFPSFHTAEDFYRRYGAAIRRKGTVLQHGLLATMPGQVPTAYRSRAQIEGVAYWSTVKPYKGVEVMLAFARSLSDAAREHLSVEIHGQWDKRLYPLRDELRAAGSVVEDRYLSQQEVIRLLSRDLVFVLPYQSASQSGVLYTLLHSGCLFVAADVGDLGDFLRRYGLDGLILKRRDAQSLHECLDYLQEHMERVVTALDRAQKELSWSRSLDLANLNGPA